MSEVQAGQVYADRDSRKPGRKIRVDEVIGDRAVCVDVDTGKKTKVKLARLTGKDYALVAEVVSTAVVAGEQRDVVQDVEQPRESLPVRVAARRFRIARNEVLRLEQVVVRARGKKDHGAVYVEKRERRLAQARERLAALEARR